MSEKLKRNVKVWVFLNGDYCTFDEIIIEVVYDITNNLELDVVSLEEIENHKYDGDNGDFQIFDAKLVDGEYFIKIN
jgi:hypothetical protein